MPYWIQFLMSVKSYTFALTTFLWDFPSFDVSFWKLGEEKFVIDMAKSKIIREEKNGRIVLLYQAWTHLL